MQKIFLSNVRLGADAEVVNGTNNQFISLRVVDNVYAGKNPDGSSKYDAVWYSVSANHDTYANMVQHWKKGSMVGIVGNLRASLYQSKSGQHGIDLKVFADSIEFLNNGTKSENSGEVKTDTNQAASTPQPSINIPKAAVTPQQPTTDTGAAQDDLPF